MEKETIEEAAKRIYPINILVDYDTNEDIRNIWIEGAKWQAERMYSEEDMKQFAEWLIKVNFNYTSNITDILLTWKEQFKKK
jgi:hypothetical protein